MTYVSTPLTRQAVIAFVLLLTYHRNSAALQHRHTDLTAQDIKKDAADRVRSAALALPCPASDQDEICATCCSGSRSSVPYPLT
jgi:hypothetical protein